MGLKMKYLLYYVYWPPQSHIDIPGLKISLSLVKLAGRLWTALSPRTENCGTPRNINFDNIAISRYLASENITVFVGEERQNKQIIFI